MHLIGEYFRDNSLDVEDEDELILADNNGTLFYLYYNKFSGNHGGTMQFAHGMAEIKEQEGQLYLILMQLELYKLNDGDYPKKYIKCTYKKNPKPSFQERLRIQLLADQEIKLLTEISSFMDTRGNFRKLDTAVNWQSFEYSLNHSIVVWEEHYKKYK